jgi:hypothetical protein
VAQGLGGIGIELEDIVKQRRHFNVFIVTTEVLPYKLRDSQAVARIRLGWSAADRRRNGRELRRVNHGRAVLQSARRKDAALNPL